MRLEDHGLHMKIWMAANDLLKKGHSDETAFVILRDTCNKMDRFVPDREIWDAIHDARRRITPLWRRVCQKQGMTEEEIEAWDANMRRLMAEFRQRWSQRTREEIEADEASYRRAKAEWEALPQSEREQIMVKYRELV